MNPALEAKLIECLSALESGVPVEQILSRYPEDAPRLRPMLQIAAALPAARLEPSHESRSKSRKAFLAHAANLHKAGQRRPFFLSRPLATLASLALALIVLGGGAVVASASALPGDPLYGLKRAVENVRLSLASDPVALAAQFDQERRDEIELLVAAGRPAQVEFRGIIESMGPDIWTIAGIPVGVDSGTQIIGFPEIGRMAGVRGLVANGQLTATSIRVEGEESSPTPTPTPGATPTPEPTETPTPTPTQPAAPSPSATPSPTRTPTPTASPAPAEIRFTGIVERQTALAWTIDRRVVEIAAATEIRGSPVIGDRVEVRALDLGGGRLIGLRIERIDEGGNDNGNDNTNDNTNDNDNQNDNGNTNDNQNGNGNDNTNDNSNGNGNGNGNSNDNGNGNGNDNDNGNGNSSDNGNG